MLIPKAIHPNFLIGTLIWFVAYNSWAQGVYDMDKGYHTDVVGITNEGLLQGSETVKQHLLSLGSRHGKLVGSESVYEVQVNPLLKYEIQSSQTDKGDQFSHIIIWSKENGSEQIIAEVIYQKTSNSDVVPAKLTEARLNWVELCNRNDAEILVSNLYTADAIYYNRGRVLTGQADLMEEYSYMNNPSYSLQLNPAHIEMVSDSIIFEIGKCSGSYNLPYILVWRKDLDENWKIYFDSNY